LGFIISACTGEGVEGSPSPTQPISGEPEVTLFPTSTPPPPPTPAPSSTPGPTARPLIEPESEPGIYRNRTVGVILEYPADWEILLIDESEIDLLGIVNPELPVFVSLQTFTLNEDDVFADFVADFIDEFASILELDEVVSETTGIEYTLGDGTIAFQSIASAEGGFLDDQLSYELLAVERGSRAFWIIIMGAPMMYEANADTLEEIRQSLRVFPPSPHGVDRENALFLSSSEPDTLDPAKWLGSAEGIVGDLFSGLVQLDTNLRPIPDLAERWDVSPDGKVYTFHLRRNVTFHNGKPFTAQDVKYSWERACNPETESNTAETYLGDIVGVSEVIAGEASSIRGLRVIDDYTIEVNLDEPKAYFLSKLAYPASWIVDQLTVNDIEENPNGTGPFMLVKRDENEVIILARNPTYHRGFVELEYIVYLIYPGYSVRLYESGEIDMITIDEDLVERAKDPSDPLYGKVLDQIGLCTFYVLFDVEQAPFDDKLVRKAFALAIDKDRYNELVYEGKGVIAQGLFPPGLPGHNPDVTAPAYDPEGALEALNASSYGGADTLPAIVFTQSGSGFDIPPSAAALMDMWESTLGVEVTIEQLDWDSMLDELHAGNHGQIVRIGWCADYPDPENFADILFHTGSKMNHSHYSNPDVDALLERARVEQDFETRIDLYWQIEQMIIEDFPTVFLGHSRAYYILLKPYIKGFVSSPIGVAQNMNLSIVRED
jgi:oligopeptide transport system substrate-binding protein